MKLVSEANPIQSSFSGKKFESRIANNEIMMETLRNKIYEDPIGSICREVADNARDAHRVVGTPKRKVRIWMPGDYLVIQDFGPGMSPDTIENVYMVFGESTKRESNLQGGGFGLGAKTPWAYTDTFIVVTVFDGVEYTYSCYIDENRKGCCVCLSEVPTDACNGTTVKIPIQDKDKLTFRQKIAWYTKYWDFGGDAIPEYIGDWKPERPKIICQDSEWIYWEKADRDGIPKYIINGIPYETNNGSYYSGQMPNTTLIFKTGELELVSNREKVQNVQKNTDKIKAITKDLGSKIVQKLMGDLDKIDNPVEVIEKINPMYHQFNSHGWNSKWKWKNQDFEYPLFGNRIMSFHIRKTRKTQQYRYSRHSNLPSSFKLENIILSDEKIQDTTGFKREWVKYIKTKYPAGIGSETIYLIEKDAIPILATSSLPIFSPIIKQGKSYVRNIVRINVLNINSSFREDLATSGLKNERYYLSDTEYSDIGSLYSLPQEIKEKTIVVKDDDVQHIQDVKKFKPFKDWLAEEVAKIPISDIEKMLAWRSFTSKGSVTEKYIKFAEYDKEIENLAEAQNIYNALYSKHSIISLAQELKLISPKTITLAEPASKYPLLEHMPEWCFSYIDKECIKEYMEFRQSQLNP